MSNYKVFTFADAEGQDIEYRVSMPSAEVQRQAQVYHNKVYSEAVKSGALLEKALHKVMREQGIWSDEKQAEYDRLTEQVRHKLRKLKEGGFKLSEAKNLAIEVADLRRQMQDMLVDQLELRTNTAEGLAESARFNFILAASLVYNKNGERVYKNVDDYIERSTDPVAIRAAEEFASLQTGVSENYEADLPEYKFLREHGFVDDKLRLINKDGKLVDREGRLINESGHYIDENNNLVDRDGNPVDENGNWLVETKPFLDDDGQPIEVKKPETVDTEEESTE